jgi:hypothetical protein
MARKDDILKSFLTHELLESKYEFKKEELPTTVREALNSDKPIIKAIALIIDGLECKPPITNPALNVQLRQYLKDYAL